MKIFFFGIFSALAVWLGQTFWPGSEALKAENISPPIQTARNLYINGQYHYSLSLPLGFKADNTIPELIILQKDQEILRINAGCFSSGVENLREIIEPITWAGLPATKAEYYDDRFLRLRRITFDHNGKCFALETQASTQTEWEELYSLSQTFRFISPDVEE